MAINWDHPMIEFYAVIRTEVSEDFVKTQENVYAL